MGLVQSASNSNTSSPSSVTVTLGSSTGAGDCLAAQALLYNGASTARTISSITLGGSAGNWAKAAGTTESTGTTVTDCEIWTDQNCAGSQTSVVITGSGAGTAYRAWVTEWSQIKLTAAVDKTNTGTALSSSSWTSNATGTLTQTAEVALGAVGVQVSSSTTITAPGSPWTELGVLNSATIGSLAAGYQVVSATTSLTYNGTLSSPAPSVGVIVTLEVAPSSLNLTTAQVNIAANALTPAMSLNLTTGQITIAAHNLSPAGALNLTTAQVNVKANPVNLQGFVNLTKTTIGLSYGTPGPVSVSPGNTDGNLLVCLAAWDVVAQTTSGGPVIPVAEIADDVENWWRLGADSGNTVPGCRTAIWVCSNARPVQRWLSVCPQGEYTSLWYVVLELFSPVANYWPLFDFHVGPSSKSASTLNAGGTATVADYCFSIGAVGNAGTSITAPGGGWNLAASGSVGGASPDSVAASTVWGAFGAGAVATTWNYGAAGQVAACTVGITQAQNLPAQNNVNFPKLVLEAALGAHPGDNTTAILDTAWTDLTARSYGPAGETRISMSGGQQYELSQPESGTMTAWLNNQDGALTPNYSGSPYFPNIKPGVPVRLSCFHLGRKYGLWAGYVERWPQEWPDMPQWGWSPMVATDVVGVASSANLPSAVQGEIWCDQPYLCLPFGEQYTASQNTVNGVSKSPSGADGQIAINTAKNNQRSGTYFGLAVPNVTVEQNVVTGQSMGFLGDSGTGMGATAYTTVLVNSDSGPGVQYGLDLGMPSLQASSTGEVTLEFWVTIPTTTLPVGTTWYVQLWSLLVPPALESVGVLNSNVNGQLLAGGFWIAPAGSNTTFFLQASWDNVVQGFSLTNINFGQLYHIVLGLNTTTGEIECYVNGVNTLNVTPGMPTGVQLNAATFGLCTVNVGQVAANLQSALSNFSMAYGTLYPYRLDPMRVAAHYQSGITGFQGDTMLQRAGRYIGWAGLNLGLGGSNIGVTDHIQLGPAYSTANAPLASALNADVLSTGAVWYANSTGNLVILGRNALYNQPAALVFGDNYPAEIPFLPDSSFDFDNTYIKNSATTTLTQGPNTLAAPTVHDQTSVNEYFQRGPLAQSISAGTAQDAIDLSWWTLNKYREPSLRVRTLVVQAAHKPSILPQLLANGLQSVATVNRRPLSGAPYALPVRIGKRQLDIGPGKWDYTYQMYPYAIEGSVLQADTPGSDVLGASTLGR